MNFFKKLFKRKKYVKEVDFAIFAEVMCIELEMLYSYLKEIAPKETPEETKKIIQKNIEHLSESAEKFKKFQK